MSVITIEGLSKQYWLGEQQAAYATLSDKLGEMMRAPFKRLKGGGAAEKRNIWALKDINLEVADGEVLGLIGHNGAGKSTLLKILSRITEPTVGVVKLYGRAASLLEVGTGFHPELTGRENIYLNGALMGMKRAEIARKFDEIVAFAETEKFLDTPVKYYSSGMYVRLAFAVAAHLEPDILIIDEVLAVGDMAFQKKCFQKISSLQQQTRAILLVSHNMISIRSICSRVVLIGRGETIADGTPSEVVPLYDKLVLESGGGVADEVEQGMGLIRINEIELYDTEGQARRSFETGERLKVMINYVATQRLDDVVVYVGIRLPDGFICTASSTKLEGVEVPPLEGPGRIELEIPELLVSPGNYVVDVVFYDKSFEFRAYFLGRKRISFEVTSQLAALDDKYGVVYQKQNWKIEQAGGREL